MRTAKEQQEWCFEHGRNIMVHNGIICGFGADLL